MIYLDHLLLPVLINTRSSIYVLSLVFCRRLNKVLLAPLEVMLRSAFSTVLPLVIPKYMFQTIPLFLEDLPPSLRPILSLSFSQGLSEP